MEAELEGEAKAEEEEEGKLEELKTLLNSLMILLMKIKLGPPKLNWIELKKRMKKLVKNQGKRM